MSLGSPSTAGSLPVAQNQPVTVDRTQPTLPVAASPLTVARPRARVRARVLDRYDLERRLGAGAFGAVWLARDTRLEREVAVKVIPRSEGPSPRAEREALAAARLNHPGIVGLYEAGADETAHYLVSELVEGVTAEDDFVGTDRRVAGEQRGKHRAFDGLDAREIDGAAVNGQTIRERERREGSHAAVGSQLGRDLIADGVITAPDRPGHGLKLSDAARTQHAVPDVRDPRALPPAPRSSPIALDAA